jgi:hypothetical protein
MRALLPDAVRLGVRLITNMGAGELLSQDSNGFDLGCVNIALQSYVGAESGTGCVASVQWILWVLRKKSWSWLLNWASQSLLLWRLRSLTSIQVNFNVRRFHQNSWMMSIVVEQYYRIVVDLVVLGYLLYCSAISSV